MDWLSVFWHWQGEWHGMAECSEWLGVWNDIHPTPCTLHPTPYTLHPTLYTLCPTPYTVEERGPCTEITVVGGAGAGANSGVFDIRGWCRSPRARNLLSLSRSLSPVQAWVGMAECSKCECWTGLAE